MALFWKSRKRSVPHVAEQNHFGDEESTPIDVNYLTLEPRRVLSADFTLVGGALELDDFSQTADENLTIVQIGSLYLFQLDEGNWSGTDNAILNGNGSSTLIAGSNQLTEVSILDSQSIGLDVEFRGTDFGNLDSASVVTTGNISQNIFFPITASTLHLTGNDIDLNHPANDFGSVSIDATTASLTDVNQIEISGADIGDKLELRAAGIDLTGTVTTDQVLFDSSQGLTQTASSSVLANNMVLSGSGDFTLNGPLNDISNVAGTVDGNIEVDVINGLAITSLECGGRSFCGINVSGDLGISTIDGDITQDSTASIFVGGNAFFAAEDGNICLEGGDCDGDGINDNVVVGQTHFSSSGDIVFAEDGKVELGDVSGANVRISGENISLHSNVTASSLLLTSSAGVASNGNTIVVDDLILMGTGNFDLSSPSNSIQNIAAEVSGDVKVSSKSDLVIGLVTHVSCGGGLSLCGLQVSGDVDLFLDDASVFQTAAAIVEGDLTIDAGAGDICLSGGDCDGDGVNDNDFNRVNIIAADEVELVDINELTINGLQANQALIQAGQLASGQIVVDGDLVANQLWLRSSDGVAQVNGSISTNRLLLDGEGQFSVDNIGNEIDFLAADISGNLVVSSTTDLTISALSHESNCSNLGVILCGVNIEGDLEISLQDADLKQTSAVIVGGLTNIDVGSGDVCLSGGDCTNDGINDNDFETVNIFSARDVEIADVDNVSIQHLNFTGEGSIIAGQTSAGKITLDGSVDAGSRLLLMASDGVEQISGSLTTSDLVLDGDGNFHLCLDNTIGSTAIPGRVSADVSGDLNINNRLAVELVNLNIATKSGVMVSHSQFDVDGSFSVTSSAGSSIAIFDSTQINVGNEASFESTGNDSDIVLDELDVFGAIGVSTAAGDAMIINQNANGIVFRDGDLPGTSIVDACGLFEQSIVNGNLVAQATHGNISNEANATLEVNGRASLIAGTSSASNLNGANNEFDIVLGTAANDDVQIDVLSANANRASIELDRSVAFADTAIGVPSSTETDGGTLFLTVDGAVTQDVGVLLSVDNVAIDATQHLILSDIDANEVAFRSGGFTDVSSLSSVPSDLPDDDGDSFAPRHTSVNSEYGIIVSSQNDLTFTTVSDATNQQQNLTGITSTNGHAFVQTLGDADIHFDGRGNSDTFGSGGTPFGLASDMQNDHVLTTIAGGDLTIAEDTVLRSTSGAVTDIGSFTTDEGRDFDNVTLEAPFFSLFLPTPSDDPTTKTVNSDDTQFIGLRFGRANELNFVVEVTWADGTLDVLDFDSDVGTRSERISHTFNNEFLTQNFELPTFLNFYNDPAINLFDNRGQSNLNSGPTDLNTNENFVLAFSDSRPQGDLQIASVSRPEAAIRESIIPSNDEQLTTETEASEFGATETVEEENISDAYLIRLDERGFEIEETRQDLEKIGITQDVIAELKQQVEDGTQFPPGQYRINWTESGVSFSIEFEKGAEEDLEPNELKPATNESLESTGPTDLKRVDPNVEDVEDLSPLSINNDHVLPLVDVRDEDEEFSDKHFEQPGRAGLIAAGALALGLKKRGANRDNEIAEELSKLAANSEGKFSFLKSARSRRRVGD